VGQRIRYGQSSSELAQHHGRGSRPFARHVDALYVVERPGWQANVDCASSTRATNFANDFFRRPTTLTSDHRTRRTRNGPRRSLMARAAVRTFGVVIVLCALHPKLRARAHALHRGTAYRWRSTRVRVADIPLASPTTSLTGGRHERRGTIALTWRAEAAHHEVDARTA